MALPENATVWTAPMDPTDLVDYRASFRGDIPLLEEMETVDTYTVALTAEAVALGVTIYEGPVAADGPQSPKLVETGSACDVWFEVDEAERENAAFSDPGASVGVVFTIITTDGRRRQRTWVLRIVQL
jgi:hypothetical protein